MIRPWTGATKQTQTFRAAAHLRTARPAHALAMFDGPAAP